MRITVMAMPDPADPAGLAGVVATVADADRAGFGRVWLPQMPAIAGAAPWDALTALAVAGQAASRIELATGVVVAYTQHPLALARQALTTHAAVGGRLTLGIGVSHPSMVEALGYAYDKPAAFLREYLEVLVPALAGEPVDHHGPRLTAVGQVTLPGLPVNKPPVVTAALGPLMLDLAGELTDGTVTSWAGPRTIERDIIPRITKAAAAAGRPAPQIIAGLPVLVTSDTDAARELIASTFEISQDAPAYRAVLAREGVDGVADVSIIGDEEQVAARLRQFADIGVTGFVPLPFGDAATVTRTTELLAALRG
ncbi:TIGR03564 family F420-dependent LLM class oxidoreductase [soil metagenome]